MYNMPRAATIQVAKLDKDRRRTQELKFHFSFQATTKGALWALDRATFRKIVLRTAFQRRKMYEALLEAVPLLTSLSVIEIIVTSR